MRILKSPPLSNWILSSCMAQHCLYSCYLNKWFYSTNEKKNNLRSSVASYGDKKIDSSLGLAPTGPKASVARFNKFRNLFIIFSISLLFIFPLKFLCKLSGASYIVLFVLSGIIAYVNTIIYRILKDKNINIGLNQFFIIFFNSICLMFLIGTLKLLVIVSELLSVTLSVLV